MKIFDAWLAAMGFTYGREGGDAIGVSESTLFRRRRDSSDMNRTELLAMSAVRAGLEPWSPEVDQEILDLLQAKKDLADVRRIFGAASEPEPQQES